MINEIRELRSNIEERIKLLLEQQDLIEQQVNSLIEIKERLYEIIKKESEEQK